jgi:RimJ/RimL family protein N-acetyltransferase
VSPGNAGSIRLLEKLGFSFSRSVRMAPDGSGSDVSVYELPP